MVGEIITRMFTFITFAYLARVLGPSTYGYLAPSYAVLMFCLLVIDMGFGTYGTREIARNLSATGSLVNRVMSAQLLLAIATLSTLVICCLSLHIHMIYVKLMIGFGVSLLGIPFLLNWVFQGRNEMLLFAAPMALRQLVFLIITIIVIAKPEDITWLPVSEIVAVAITAMIYILSYRGLGRHIRLSLKKALDRDLFVHALPIGGAQIIWALRMYLPIIIIGAMLGPSSAGYFDIGHRVVIVFVAFLGVYFTNLLPAMSLISHDSTAALGQMLIRSVMISLIPSILLAVTVMFTAPLILGVIYGEMFVRSESINAFSALIWMIPVLAARRNGRTALITINCQYVDFWISVAGIILMISMVIPVTYFFGIEGTAWAMVISELISAIITWMFLIPGLKRITGRQDRFQQS